MPDPAALRKRLLAAGALPDFRGMMIDVRFDRNGELIARDEVLRIRRFLGDGIGADTVLAWKGPTGISPEGHKERRELEFSVQSRHARPEDLLEALHYTPVYTIERYVEYYHSGATVIRIEWYPRMDTLVEIEGDASGIAQGIRMSGLPAESFSADALAGFVARFQERTGTQAVLAQAELGQEAPTWKLR